MSHWTKIPGLSFLALYALATPLPAQEPVLDPGSSVKIELPIDSPLTLVSPPNMGDSRASTRGSAIELNLHMSLTIAERRIPPASAESRFSSTAQGIRRGRQGFRSPSLHRCRPEPGIHHTRRYPPGTPCSANRRTPGPRATGRRPLRRSQLLRPRSPQLQTRHDLLGNRSPA